MGFTGLTLLAVALLQPFHVEAAWYKGNTHSHSLIFLKKVVPHGDSLPGKVARWYAKRDYNFLVISEHNRFIDPDKVRVPKKYRNNFMLIPGMEVTSDYRFPGSPEAGEKSIHTTALGIDQVVDWNFSAEQSAAAILQDHVNRTRIAGGMAIINHPNYRGQLTGDDLAQVSGWTLFELYNAHPASKNFGKPGERASVEQIWDQLLTAGRAVYGVASDDAHGFRMWKRPLRKYGAALPGGGWVMVSAESLTQPNILAALENGDFYSSNGVHLKTLQRDPHDYIVEVDEEKTFAEIENWWVNESAPETTEADGVKIEFIGDGGQIIQRTPGLKARLLNQGDGFGFTYIRARVTFTRSGRTYYAWTQPAFL